MPDFRKDYIYDWHDGGGEGIGPLSPNDHNDHDDSIRLPLWLHALFDCTPAFLMLVAGGFFLIGCEVLAHVVSCKVS